MKKHIVWIFAAFFVIQSGVIIGMALRLRAAKHLVIAYYLSEVDNTINVLNMTRQKRASELQSHLESDSLPSIVRQLSKAREDYPSANFRLWQIKQYVKKFDVPLPDGCVRSLREIPDLIDDIPSDPRGLYGLPGISVSPSRDFQMLHSELRHSTSA